MINLTVLNIKDIIKGLVKFIAIIIFVIICTRFFNLMKNIDFKDIITKKFKAIEGKTYLEVINDNISLLKGKVNSNLDDNKENKNNKDLVNNIDKENYFCLSNIIDNILNKEISFLGYIDSKHNIDNKNDNNLKEEEDLEKTDDNDKEIKMAKKEAETEVINENNKKDTYNKTYNGVKIKNESKYKLTEKDLKPDIDFKNKKDIVIYHTHTCESYTPTEQYQYTASGNFRTIDLNFSVSRVGDELEKWLSTYGCTVIHDRTYHDYPAYNGSYSRSLVTAQNVLSTNQDADIVIDLHRDAIADETYGPRVKIGDEYVSQLMFVIGTDGANSAHTNWLQNLKFAIKVQQKANELYPGLFKPIILRNSEYNQHVAKAACIIEVGSTGNTLEESMGAMKYLARILEET